MNATRVDEVAKVLRELQLRSHDFVDHVETRRGLDIVSQIPVIEWLTWKLWGGGGDASDLRGR